MQQVVEYEWRPPYCAKCQKLGHTYERKQPKQPSQKWLPKDSSTQPILQVVETTKTSDQNTSKAANQELQSPTNIQKRIFQESEDRTTWTEVRKKTKDRNKDINNGNNPIHTSLQVKHGNGFETLRNSSSLMFLNEVP